MKRRSSIFIPPARVAIMIVFMALIMGGLFAVMMGSAIGGALVGVAVAAAFYLFIVVNARGQARKLKRR